jgi:NAD(P)-dependent dehydrogenase (short-subunit alcohol dehydrogenase family)
MDAASRESGDRRDFQFREVDVERQRHEAAPRGGLRALRPIDVAFNNAGVSGKTAPLQDLDDAGLRC